jgi:hypothetical protein
MSVLVCNQIDDFLDKQDFKTLQEEVLSNTFNWHYQSSTCPQLGVDTSYFVHIIYDGEGELHPIFHKAIEKGINEFLPNYTLDKVLRCRVNCNLQSEVENILHTDHTDSDVYSLFVYMDNADGNTYVHVRNDEVIVVSPKENRALLFNANIKHRGSNPQRDNRRVLCHALFRVKK